MSRTGTLTEINDQEITALKADIASYPRLCGYYVVGSVSVRDLRARAVPQEAILETVIDYFDEDPTEPAPGFVPDHQWAEYGITLEKARSHTFAALVGGRRIGNISETMAELTAGDLFDRFVSIRGKNPRFYIGLGIGDRN